MYKLYDKLKLANPGIWCGQGCDVNATFTVYAVKHPAEGFGSGTALRVRPAIQPNHPDGEDVWYDSENFTDQTFYQTSKPFDDERNIVVGDIRIVFVKDGWILPGGYKTTDRDAALAVAVELEKLL